MSLYGHAGGAEAMLALARAFHARALADPVLEHPFSKPGQHPQHVERLAAYWGQALGGPPAYTDLGGDQATMKRMHLGQSGGTDTTGMRRRFVACVDAAADDAALPADPAFRDALHAYMSWAVQDLRPAHDDPARVPDGLTIPKWSWEGLLARG